MEWVHNTREGKIGEEYTRWLAKNVYDLKDFNDLNSDD